MTSGRFKLSEILMALSISIRFGLLQEDFNYSLALISLRFFILVTKPVTIYIILSLVLCLFDVFVVKIKMSSFTRFVFLQEDFNNSLALISLRFSVKLQTL